MRTVVVLIWVFICQGVCAQEAPDTSVNRILVQSDSVSVLFSRDTIKPKLIHAFTSDSFRYQAQLFFRFTNPVRYTVSEVKWEGREIIFYAVVGLIISFSVIKNNFSRYLTDLFSSYFRTTMRQRQVKDQLLQSPLPSLMFNVFFALSAGIFLALLAQYLGQAGVLPFWQLFVYACLGVGAIYGVKYLVLKFSGWAFGAKAAADTYVFIVFSTNKILGVCLIPLIVLLAFTGGEVQTSAMWLSFLIIGGLYFYRFFLAFISVNSSLSISIFHFLLYFAAFEILPLMLINKLLFTFLREIA